ncbi:MAG: leucine-rich repeat domain-containing protein [Clostridia bacterium]|nr:leucine-rich repeat domain-containing protein [Clostridia bacterium]
MKRQSRLILASALMLALLWCGAALADGNQCGDDVFWSLSGDGRTLTLYGSGSTENYIYQFEGHSPPFTDNALFANVTDVIIGEGITAIGRELFYGCESITSVSLPSTLREIRDEAFYGCSSLASVVIPEGVTDLGNYAFRECRSLTSVHIPNSLTYVYTYVFQSCHQLTDVNIPSNWTSLGVGMFSGCESLSHVTLPDGLDSIARDAFADCLSLTGIEIPASVFTIGEGAFEGSGLTAVTLPAHVASIGTGAFSNCQNLTNISLPNSLRTIGSYAFARCTGLSGIVIPANVTNIDWNAFQDCPTLYSVAILSEEAVLDENLFALEEFTSCPVKLYGYTGSTAETYALENGIPFVALTLNGQCGDHVTWSLDLGSMSLIVGGSGPMWDFPSDDPDWYPFRGSIRAVTVQSGVTHIGSYAFYMMNSLTGVSLPSTLTSIGEYAFGYAYNLPAIPIPSGVHTIGSGAFCRCDGLVNSAGFYIFRNVLYCYAGSATAVTVPAGVTCVSGSAFKNCADVTDVILPDSVTSIGEYAFSDCYELTSINLPEGLTAIGDSAFCLCRSLTSVDIPESVTVIGNGAFIRCYSLTSATIRYPFVPIGDKTFVFTRDDLVLRGYTASSTELHAGLFGYGFEALPNCGICGDAVYWRLDGDVLTIKGSGPMKNYSTSTNSPFKNSMAIHRVEIGETVTSVGAYAFYGASGITSLNLGGAESIGQYAFKSCYGLTDVELPVTVSSLAHYAFQSCLQLRTVTIFNDEISIAGTTTFNSCPNLTFCGNALSAAETYAVANRIPFVLMDVEPTFFLPEDLTLLESQALSGIPVIAVVIPNPATLIERGAFDGSSVRYIFCLRDSQAQAYAQYYGFVFSPIDADWLAAH